MTSTNGIQKNIAGYKGLSSDFNAIAIPALLGWVINFPLRELPASVPEFAVVESSLLDVLLPRTRCSGWSTLLLKLSNWFQMLEVPGSDDMWLSDAESGASSSSRWSGPYVCWKMQQHSWALISCHTHKPGCNQYLGAPATIKYLIKVAGKVDPTDGLNLICFMI